MRAEIARTIETSKVKRSGSSVVSPCAHMARTISETKIVARSLIARSVSSADLLPAM